MSQDPTLAGMATDLLAKLNLNMTAQQMEQEIDSFLGQSIYGNDIWMTYQVSQSDSSMFRRAIDFVPQQFNDPWQCTAPTYTSMDGIINQLAVYENGVGKTTPQYNLANALLIQITAFGSNADPNTFYSQIITPMLTVNLNLYSDNIYTDPQYAGLKPSDFNDILSQLSYTNCAYQVPPFANTYFQYAYWYYDQGGGSAQKLASDLMTQMVKNWSPTSTFDPTAWMNKALGDSSGSFFTNYPGITWADFQAFATASQYTCPAWTQQYLQVGYWFASEQPSGNDFNTAQYVFNQMQTAWPSGSSPLPALQQWAQTAFNNMFTGMPDPDFDLTGAQQLESIFNLTAPAFQAQYFQCLALSQTLTGADKAMMQDLITKVFKSNWPSGNIMSTYNSLVQTNDLYMLYPNASNAAIQDFVGAIGANATETTVDSLYRSSVTIGAGYPVGSNDAKLFAYLQNLCWTTGSNNPNGTADIDNWVNQEVTKMPPFSDYQPLQSGTAVQLLSLFSFQYTATYYNVELILMAGQNASPATVQFIKSIRSIISGYSTSGQNPSIQGLQTYLNTNYASLDFCFQFPGLSPTNIASVFNTLQLQSPHTYTTLDTACFDSFNAEQQIHPAPNSPDTAAFDQLYLQMEVAERNYDLNNPNADLFAPIQNWIGNLRSSTEWGNLSGPTQQAFIAIQSLGNK